MCDVFHSSDFSTSACFAKHPERVCLVVPCLHNGDLSVKAMLLLVCSVL